MLKFWADFEEVPNTQKSDVRRTDDGLNCYSNMGSICKDMPTQTQTSVVNPATSFRSQRTTYLLQVLFMKKQIKNECPPMVPRIFLCQVSIMMFDENSSDFRRVGVFSR